jgi:hypothetical protein
MIKAAPAAGTGLASGNFIGHLFVVFSGIKCYSLLIGVTLIAFLLFFF